MLYVGTYSLRGSEGVYGLDFDPEDGALARRGALAGLDNPAFLALHPNGRWLYAVSEGNEGAVAAIALQVEPGVSPLINQQSTLGSAPCHLAVDSTGEWLVTANYGSGSVVLHPIRADGSLGEAADLAQHSGSGPNAGRQEGPHAHSVTFDPSGRFAIAADLGIDRLMVYLLDREQGKLVPHAQVVVAPGAGPRHFAFHPSGKWAYLITELANTVVAYAWDADAGALTELQTVPTLPAEFTGVSHCADIHVHPSGRYLYGSNRGHDSLAVFGIDETTGQLEPRGHVSTGGGNPRNFALTADGRWLLVANQDTDSIVAFRVEGAKLEAVGEPFSVPAPVCLVSAN